MHGMIGHCAASTSEGRRSIVRSLSMSVATRRTLRLRTLLPSAVLAVVLTVLSAWIPAYFALSKNFQKFGNERSLGDGRTVHYSGHAVLGRETYVWGIDREPTAEQLSEPISDESRKMVDSINEFLRARKPRDPTWGPLKSAWEGRRGGLPITAIQSRAGLPFLSMAMWSEHDDVRNVREYSWTGGRALIARWKGSVGTNQGVPLLPMWPGFAANVLIYFLAMQSLVCTWYLWWARRRILAGRCPFCNYEMNDRLLSDGCPECGWRRAGRAGGTARS